MRVRIYESGQDDLAVAINLSDFLAVLFDPRIAQRVFTLAHRDNFAAHAEHCGIFEHAEFSKPPAPSGTGLRRFITQSQQLPDVDQ